MSSKKLEPKNRGANTDRLTAQQQLFVEAFFANRRMNASEAAKAAGYEGKNAGVKLLANPVVKAVLQKRMRDIMWEHRADRERIVQELTCIAFMNPQDLLREDGSITPLQELPQQTARTISRMKVSYVDGGFNAEGDAVTMTNVDVSFHDKLSAIELLMRHLGMMDAIKLDVKHTVDWDEMVSPHANPEAAIEESNQEDPIEQRILALE